MSKKLKPCPWCKGDVEIVKSVRLNCPVGKRHSFGIGCFSDGCQVNPQGRPLSDRAAVVEAWNQREGE